MVGRSFGSYLMRRGHFCLLLKKSFDFCYSTSVFEHVMDYNQPLSEICRVLRPGAWTLHIFPARWRPVEPHIFTPFGGRFQRPAPPPTGMPRYQELFPEGSPGRRDCRAQPDLQQGRNSNYPPKREIVRAFGRYFDHVEFIEREFVAATRGSQQAIRAPGPGDLMAWRGGSVPAFPHPCLAGA